MANQSNSFDGANVSGGFNLQGNQFNGNVSIRGPYRDDTDGLHCLRLLKAVNPEDERRRILTVKDQLVTASYSWILEDETFRSWLDGNTNHLLWIKGGPGKGKTMMMAGLVEILSKERNSDGAIALCYFFCQNSETELRSVSSIVKSLIYMLVFREKSLIDHLKKTYEAGGEEAFTGPRALFTLWRVLEDMLRDFHGARVYLIVDGLDECDDPEFDDFLRLLSGCNLTTPGKIKWLVTSRPLPRIEDIIGPDQNKYRISLEIEARNVSQGVETFINEKVSHLSLKRHWSPQIAQKVYSYLQSNAEGTFLWVALVCRRLQGFPSWKVETELANLANLQRGLDSFYDRMMQVVRDEIPDCADLCMKILRTTTLAYRPLHMRELGTVVALPHELQRDDSPNFDALKDLIERCGSFILVHEDTIYFVHQSAKDYLSTTTRDFSLDRLQEHSSIAEKCLDALNSCLKDHEFPDPASLSRQELNEDESRLLPRIAYACSYWIHHTLESCSRTSSKEPFPNQEKICNLLDSHLIAWVHALGSLKELTACVRMIKALLDIQGFESPKLFHIMHDTYRFLRQSRYIIEESPNQAYTSALLFVPRSSWVRENYQNRIPKWIRLRTQLNNTWDACLETFLGHSRLITRLAFSSDGSLLASRSDDCTRLWETETGRCRGLLCHNWYSRQLAFSPDNRVLVSGSDNGLELLDTITGSQRSSLTGHISWIRGCLFAPDSQILASAEDSFVRLWNTSTGANCGIFELEGRQFRDMAFSHDSKRIIIASASDIEVRDLGTSNIATTFREHCCNVVSVESSPDSHLALSASSESIWLWTQATTNPGKRLEGHIYGVKSAKFSPDGRFIVSTHEIGSAVVLWETSTGNKLHVLTVPFANMCEAMFSPDSKVITTPLRKGVKSWDTTTGQEITSLEAIGEENEGRAEFAICSEDGNLFARVTNFKTRIWEVATGTLLDTLEGHSDEISDLTFSPVGGLIASASYDGTVKLWNLDKSLSNQTTFRKGATGIETITLSSDNSLAATISVKHAIRIWDLKSGSSKTILDGTYTSRQLVISPDNSLLAVYTVSDVLILETGTGLLRCKIKKKYLQVHRFAFSPDSRLLKIEESNGSIRLAENNAREFEPVQRPSPQEPAQSQVSPDAMFLAELDSSDAIICLWERQEDTTKPAFKFICDLGRPGGVATFSPDSKLVAFVSNEHFISVWETKTGACHSVTAKTISCFRVLSISHDNHFIACTSGSEHKLGILELSNGLLRELPYDYADSVNLVKFSPDSSILAAISGSEILLWETTSGSLSGKLKHDRRRISDITFLPDQSILIAGHEDGTIRSWDTNNHVLLHTLCTRDHPPRLSFDSKRKFLWTGNQGFFLDEIMQPCEEPAISIKEDWVMFNGERVFWLPTEFRPTDRWTWSASSNRLVVGHRFDDVTLVDFDI